MKIIVDIMGGDKAPEETVKGAIQAAREFDPSISYIWVGNQNDIKRIAEAEQFDLAKIEIVHAEDVITMEDDPLTSARGKPNSSMSLALKLLAEGRGDALVSTGNTGALFTGATLLVRKVKGVQRAGIATLMPFDKPMLLFDSGANVAVTPENLEQFTIVGSAYMRKVFGIEKPRVGLLNNGAEECKGTDLHREAYSLLSNSPDICFVGNVEGSTMAFDVCDILVTDGFTGNILLKSSEGIVKLMLKKLKGMFKGSLRGMLAYLLLKPELKALKGQLDPAETGGAPILGISKPVFKAHGSSDARSFKNAIRQAIRYVESGAMEELSAAAQAYAVRKKAEREAQKQTEQ